MRRLVGKACVSLRLIRCVGGASAGPSPLHSGPRTGDAELDSIPLSHIPVDSPLSFRSRLENARFSSPTELLAAPYAPSPLKLLIEVLRRGISDPRFRLKPAQLLVYLDAVTNAIDAVVDADSLLLNDRTTAAVKEQLRSFAELDALMFGGEGGTEGQHPLQKAWGASRQERGESAGDDACMWSLLADRHLHCASRLGLWQEAMTSLWELKKNDDGARAAVESAAISSLAVKSTPEDEESQNNNNGPVAPAIPVVRLSSRHFDKAIRACRAERRFDEAMLMLQMARTFDEQKRVESPASDPLAVPLAVAGVAECITVREQLELLRGMFAGELSQLVPVSSPLYAALINAAARVCTTDPAYRDQGHEFALSLYRSLRDNEMHVTPEGYAGLMAITAALGEPTPTFAFYHEAKLVHGISNLPPALYSNLLRSYVVGGFTDDALSTLDVLAEAKAPLDRTAFHVVMAGAQPRQAYELMHRMVRDFGIAATPETYRLLVGSLARKPEGAETVLAVYDIHKSVEAAVRSEISAGIASKNALEPPTVNVGAPQIASPGSPDANASPAPVADPVVEHLLDHHQGYVVAVERCLLRTRIPLSRHRTGEQLVPYAAPLFRIAQERMNALCGVHPQCPTRIARGSLVGVLGYDVLLHGESAVGAIADQFSSLVVPYSSAAVALRELFTASPLSSKFAGDGPVNDLLVDDADERGVSDDAETRGGDVTRNGHRDPWRKITNEALDQLKAGWGTVGEELQTLRQFLAKHHDVMHMMSLQEEAKMSEDVSRYAIPFKDLSLRCVAVAANLARGEPCGTDVYRRANARVVLLTADPNCHRLVKRNKLLRKHIWVFNPMLGAEGLMLGGADADGLSPLGLSGVGGTETPTIRDHLDRQHAQASAPAAHRPPQQVGDVDPSAIFF